MKSVISLRNLTAYWAPGEAWGHAVVLAPLLAIHEAQHLRRTSGEVHSSRRGHAWEWVDRRSVEEALPVLWHMTGRWKARRVVSVRRATFEEGVAHAIPRLAKKLNQLEVTCLRVPVSRRKQQSPSTQHSRAPTIDWRQPSWN